MIENLNNFNELQLFNSFKANKKTSFLSIRTKKLNFSYKIVNKQTPNTLNIVITIERK